MKYVLTIAGSDPIGGAGIQADIKTITSIGCHALTAVTALTAQNSKGVKAIQPVPVGFILRQIEAVMEDIIPDAVKLGMIFTASAIKGVAKAMKNYSVGCLVVDPVLKSSTGDKLLQPEALSAMKERILPLARVVTPNLHEAEAFTGMRVRNLRQMEEACRAINALGPAVIVKGGHLPGEPVDILFDGTKMVYFRGERIKTLHTHGTGCVFSSALACFLAMGHSLEKASRRAHDFVRASIMGAYPCGTGAGPVNPARI